MRGMLIIFVLLGTGTVRLQAQPARFVIDDDTYSDKIVQTAQKLVKEHQLLSLDTLRRQVHTKGIPLNLLPPAHEKLEPPDLYDRLRQSTFAVGTFYKCPDCGGWHFSSSTGFVFGESGMICTCCHVILEEDQEIKESYLIAADASGRVFPIQAVLAADTDADTCIVRINAAGLKPLPLRSGVRAGESVFCLSHPGGYFFMFTQGLVARVNRRTNADEVTQGTAPKSRPILLLNITAEFAPGSSGAPVVDVCGNVVGQVASIADAGEASPDEDNQATSPSVAVRFCTAAEELLHLTNPNLAPESHSPSPHPAKKPKPKVRKLNLGNRCPVSKINNQGPWNESQIEN
jgi:S1-C subfamily serine protease